MDPKLVEKLHEAASSAYLQGDVEGALSAWRQVLEADPDDERAREGVELCERMSGCESGSVVTDGQSPFAVGAPSEHEQAAEMSDSELSDPLDKLLDMGAAPALPQSSKESSAEAAPADEQGGVLDFSDLMDDGPSSDDSDVFDMDDLLSAPSGDSPFPEAGASVGSLFNDDPSSGPTAEKPPPETTWHFGVGPGTPDPAPPDLPGEEFSFGSSGSPPDPPGEEFSFGSPGSPPDPPADPTSFGVPDAVPDRPAEEAPFIDPPPEVFTGDVSTAGLHRRVSDLLATALAEMERGDRELALTTLDRLLILDDENEAACSLKRKLLAEVEGKDAVTKDASDAFESLGMGDALDDPLELNFDTAVKDEEAPEKLADSVVDGEAGPEPSEVEVPDSAPPQLEELDLLDETAPETAASDSRVRRFALPAIPVSKKIWIPATAVILLGLGFVFWNTILGGGEAVGETTLPTAHAENSSSAAPKPKPDNGSTEQPVDAVVPKSAEEQLAEILQQADAALAGADYAAAIVSFNAALQLDPQNPELGGRLKAAVESYRIQQEKQERWNRAVKEFEQGDYRAAMAYFYRLPEEEHTEAVERYIRNGWYNLGVSALKNRDCNDAFEHFSEARRLDSGDAGILEAADLAVRCKNEGSAAIRASVVGLQYRGIEDTP